MRPSTFSAASIAMRFPPAEGLSKRVAFEQCGRCWPGFQVSFSSFDRHLDSLGYTEHQLPRYCAEIYLCIGCSEGKAAACRSFEASFLQPLRASIHSLEQRADSQEEILQRVRDRLFVGQRPRVLSYRGDGPLSGWLRIVLRNAARDYIRSSTSARLETSEIRLGVREGATQTWNEATVSPEEDVVFADYVQAFREGLVQGVLDLREGDRQLLHHSFVGGLSMDLLGAMYSVDRSTVARRIRRAVDCVGSRMREQLSMRLGRFADDEFACMSARTILDRCDINAAQLLAAPVAPPWSQR